MPSGADPVQGSSGRIRPIETRYAGCRFRSRLEARWAVFFDRLGLTWEYEPEGFELSDGSRYLPDFRLPLYDRGPWVECKPPGGDFTKPIRLVRDGGGSVWLAEGPPAVRSWLLAIPGPPGECLVETVVPFVEPARAQNRFYYDPEFTLSDIRAGFQPWGYAVLGEELPSAVEAALSSRFEEEE